MQARRHLITLALVAGLGATAFAQTPPGGAPGTGGPQAHGHRHDPARMAERMNRRMDALKQQLHLSPAQEPAWTSFTNALRPTGDRQRMDREALARMATPDRLDHLRVLRNQRNAEMDRRADATKAFYAQLTPDQKKIFDSATARGHRGGHKHHG